MKTLGREELERTLERLMQAVATDKDAELVSALAGHISALEAERDAAMKEWKIIQDQLELARQERDVARDAALEERAQAAERIGEKRMAQFIRGVLKPQPEQEPEMASVENGLLPAPRRCTGRRCVTYDGVTTHGLGCKMAESFESDPDEKVSP